MSFRRFVTGVALALPLLLPAAARADVKIGYVDMQRALSEVEEYRSAMSRLQKSLESKTTELKKEEDALLKEAEMLSKQSATMNDEAKRARQGEIQAKYISLREKQARAQEELAKSQERELKPIETRFRQVIDQIAQREGFTLVVNSAVVLYAPPSLELTNEVVRLYNDRYKSGKAASKPKPADAPKK